MRTLFLFFGFLCTLTPLIGIPLAAHYFNNAHLLIGLLFSFSGSIAAFRKSPGFLAPPLIIVCIEVWKNIGNNLQLQLGFFLICSLWGYTMAVLTNQYSLLNTNQIKQ